MLCSLLRNSLDGLAVKRSPLDHAGAADDVPLVEATVSETDSTGAAAVRVDGARDESSRYVVQSEVARGGLGRVLKAHDERLDRPVALKESLASGGVLDERFRREAAITARLQHPSIVPVYDAGTWKNGAPYYVMKLLGSGSTLKQLVAAAKDLDRRLALLPHVIAVADAIAYAHSLDIIHRDLKPSNVLVGPFGETLVIDWGLAKDLARPLAEDDLAGDPYRGAAPDLTSLGSVIGTPQYMAPEQARGEAVDKRADVYSLGALLYYVLSGEPPYAGESSVDVLARVRAQEPVALTVRTRAIPEDLAAIVGKAMARSPNDRYASAGELVDDLKRFQTGQLVGAQQYSAATLLWRWMTRHRAPLAVALVFLVASSVMALVGVRRIARARDVADVERAAAVAKRNELILLQARSSLKEDPTKAMAWLKSYPLDGSDWTTVQALASRARSLGVARHLLPTGIITDAVVLSDGKRLVTSGPDRKVTLWDIERAVALDSIAIEDKPLATAVASDSSRVAIGTIKGEVVLWDLTTHQVHLLARLEAFVASVKFSPDGQWLAATGARGPCLWNLKEGSFRQLAGHAGMVNWIRFSKDGRTLFSAGDDGRLLSTTVVSGSSTTRQAHQGPITELTLSDDGLILATAGRDGTIRVWPAAGGPGHVLSTSSQAVRAAQFLPHSHRIATESEGVESVWDVDSGLELRRSPQQPEEIRQHDISPDGTHIALGGAGGSLQIWEWQSDRTFVLRGHAMIMALAFAGDGTLISGGMDRETRVWPAEMWPAVPRRVVRLDDPLTHLVMSADGSRFAAAGGTNVHVCAVATGPCQHLIGSESGVYGIAFSPDGSQVLSAGGDRSARLWTVMDGSHRTLAVAGAKVHKAQFTDDGSQIMAASSDGSIYIWPTAGGEPTVLAGHVGDVRSVAISPDGHQLASAGEDRTVRIWDKATGSGRILGAHEKPVYYVAFSPDGKALATGSDDGTVRLWDIARGTWREVARYRELVSGIAFSVDGHFLASCSWDGSASVWNTRTGRSQSLSGHEGRIRSLAWSPDGQVVATGSDDQTVHVWNVVTGAVEVLQGHGGSVRSLAFAVDGSLASASQDKTVRIWSRAPPVPAPREPKALARWMSSSTSSTVP
jgi:WD40 repeat protein